MLLSLLRSNRGNWTLIGLLVAVAVGLIIMFTVLLPRIMPGEQARQAGLVQPKPGQTVLGASLDKGKETQCMSNLRQIRMMLNAQSQSGEQLPATLQDMKLGSAGVCPVSGQPYQYDATTGQVKCTTPGHEKL
jgi:hypothetical protein